MIWSELPKSVQDNIVRRYQNGELVDRLAREYDLLSSSLSRKMRLLGVRRSVAGEDERTRRIKIERPTRMMFMSCLHFGDHDRRALGAALKIAELWQPEIVFLIGDILNGGRVSRYLPDGSAISSQAERDMWCEWSESLSQVVGKNTEKHIVFGNHDLRYIHTLMRQSPEYLSLEEMSMSGILCTDELGYHRPVEWIEINPVGDELYPEAQLYVFHGDIARSGAGNSIRYESDRYGEVNAVMGHTHKSAFVARATDRGIVRGYEVGCLCNLKPHYARFVDWQQAVLIGSMSWDYFDFHHIMIDRGRFLFDNTMYELSGY